MALRISEYIACGELENPNPWSIYGTLKFHGTDRQLFVTLTGSFAPDLAGKRIRFEARPEASPWAELRTPSLELVAGIAPHQVGTPGLMTAARRSRIPLCTPEELTGCLEKKAPFPSRWMRCLYLEWYSQNGRVVIEMADPVLSVEVGQDASGKPIWEALPEPEWERREPAEPAASSEEEEQDAAEFACDMLSEFFPECLAQEDELDVPDDFDVPGGECCGLHFVQFGRQDELAAGREEDGEAEDAHAEGAEGRSTRRGAGKCLRSILSPSLFEYDMDELDEARAGVLLTVELTKLARFGIALHVCHHYDARSTLRLLMGELGRDAHPFGERRYSSTVRNYDTANCCPQCLTQMREPRPDRGNKHEESGEVPF